MGRILAIDYGRKRTGLAVTDPMQLIANPLTTVATHTLVDYLTQYFATQQVECVVIGLPKQLNNQPSESMRYIEPFVARYKRLFPTIPIEYFDERFTSALAHQAMREANLKKKERENKALVDKVSAVIILQDYLESRRYL